ncbi:MAG: FkbM family methyltransferase [Flavobacteriales bacterium]
MSELILALILPTYFGMTDFEKITKNFFQKFGILIRRYHAGSCENLRRLKLMQHHGIDLVLDVGANKGQYAESLLQNGFGGKVISFEPLSKVHADLTKNAKKYANWIVAPRCAVGAEESVIEMNITENLVSSTALKMLNTHLEGAKESRVIGSEKADLKTLNSFYEEYVKGYSSVYLKIDVQGFEREVLKGAARLYPHLKGIEIEMSMVPLYENQDWLFKEILDEFTGQGFKLMSISPAFTDNNTGQILQCDGIFIKQN